MRRVLFMLVAVMTVAMGCPLTVEGRLVEGVSSSVSSPQVDVSPSFKGGGTLEFSKWVNAHLNYPKSAKEDGIQGRVLVAFTVKANGQVGDVKVVKGVDPALDAEAVRVVSKSPKWKPGYSDGKPVDVSYTVPVVFKLGS